MLRRKSSLPAALIMVLVATMSIGCSTDSSLGSNPSANDGQHDVQLSPNDLGRTNNYTFDYYGIVMKVEPNGRVLALGKKELMVRVDKNVRAYFVPDGKEITDIFGYLKEGMVIRLYGQAPRTPTDLPVIELIEVKKNRLDGTHRNQL